MKDNLSFSFGALINKNDLKKIEKQINTILAQTNNKPITLNIDDSQISKISKAVTANLQNIKTESAKTVQTITTASPTGYKKIAQTAEMANGQLVKTSVLLNKNGDEYRTEVSVIDNVLKLEKEREAILKKTHVNYTKEQVNIIKEQLSLKLKENETLDQLNIKASRMDKQGRQIFQVEKLITETIKDQNGEYQRQHKILEDIAIVRALIS